METPTQESSIALSTTSPHCRSTPLDIQPAAQEDAEASHLDFEMETDRQAELLYLPCHPPPPTPTPPHSKHLSCRATVVSHTPRKAEVLIYTPQPCLSQTKKANMNPSLLCLITLQNITNPMHYRILASARPTQTQHPPSCMTSTPHKNAEKNINPRAKRCGSRTPTTAFQYRSTAGYGTEDNQYGFFKHSTQPSPYLHHPTAVQYIPHRGTVPLG